MLAGEGRDFLLLQPTPNPLSPTFCHVCFVYVAENGNISDCAPVVDSVGSVVVVVVVVNLIIRRD